MKSIIALLTISIIFLAAFVMKQKNPGPKVIDAFAGNNEKKAETVLSDKREIVIAFNEKTVAASPADADIETVGNDASKDDLRDSVRRKDKEAALAIVSRIMKEKGNKDHGESKDGNYDGRQSLGSSEEGEVDEDDDED